MYCCLLLPLLLPPVPLPLLVPLHLYEGGGREEVAGWAGMIWAEIAWASCQLKTTHMPVTTAVLYPVILPPPLPSPLSPPTHCTCSRSCSRCTASESASVPPAPTVVPQEESLSAETRRPSGRTLRPLEERGSREDEEKRRAGFMSDVCGQQQRGETALGSRGEGGAEECGIEGNFPPDSPTHIRRTKSSTREQGRGSSCTGSRPPLPPPTLT